MKNLRSVSLSVSFNMEDYSSENAVIDFPALSGEDNILNAMRAAIPALFEAAGAKITLKNKENAEKELKKDDGILLCRDSE